MRALAAAVDAKDPYTRYHSVRVSRYATLIAQRLGFSMERIYALAIAGELHDVGKLAVPDLILLKEVPLRAYLNRRVYLTRGELFGVGGEPAERVVDGTFNWACEW